MVEHQCEKCKCIYYKKSHLVQHLNKKNPCKPKEENTELLQNPPHFLQIPPLLEVNEKEIEQTKTNYVCEFCNGNFSKKYNLERHQNGRCKEKEKNKLETQNINEQLKLKNDEINIIKQELNDLKKENSLLKNQIFKSVPKTNQINKIHKSIKKLETTIPANTNLSISNQLVEKLIQKDKQLEKLITVNTNKPKANFPDDNFEDLIEQDDMNQNNMNQNNMNQNNMNQNEKIKNVNPITLILNNSVIEYRKSDGYINATQLCKAGGKKLSHWINLESTKELINVLASDTGIPASLLVDIKKGNSINFEQGTWIHSDLAIQLAQWISSRFALQVSTWIRTLFTNGRVEIDIKLLKEQENIIKDCDKKIKHLNDLILKKQPRNKYDESVNVVYIITNEYTKSNRTYTIGKAKNLIDRLSTYDKLQTHEVVYSKSFKNESMMKIAEDIVLTKLNKYKEIECRDRFILPIGEDIKLFIKPINDVYNLLID